LIANAAKYGNGRIVVSLQPDPAFGFALSVANGGPALPEGFDPGASTGLGMRIIQSFARQIGGELRIGRGDDGQGARFTVLFPGTTAVGVSGMPNPGTTAISASSRSL
jgi:two-component sensor histidine kinase